MYANVVYSAAGKHISQIALVVFAHIGVPFSNLRIGGVYPCNFPRFRVFSFNQANIGQYDSEGHLELVSTKRPTPSDLKTALYKFSGEIKQVPPAFSAIKIDGKRAYKLAREGTAANDEELRLKLKPRQVTIYSIKLISYRYPTVKFKVDVSSGTYIRSIINDLGKELQTGAHMTALRRESIGPYAI